MATVIVVLSAGTLTGLLLLHLVKLAIQKRTGKMQMPGFAWISAKYAPALWAALNAGIWLSVYLGYGVSLYAFNLVFACSVCLVISVVDCCIRMIPNEALLVLALAAVAGLFVQGSWGNALDHLLGFLLGCCVFSIPFLMKKKTGAGDIKFAATMGLFLGLYNTIAALAVMSILLLVYIAALFASGKGNYKSTVALGPYISAGFVITMAIL